MSTPTTIEWADYTWNLIYGCTKVSPGCDHCYIDRTPPFRMAGLKFDKPGIGGATPLIFHDQRMYDPIRKRKRGKWFVNSLSDMFHKDVPDEFIARAFAVMRLADHHIFQLLTKRPWRMRALLDSEGFWLRVDDATRAILMDRSTPISWGTRRHLLNSERQYPRVLPNLWGGVTTENQELANRRIPSLLMTPLAVRFLSMEPLLGPVDLTRISWPRPRAGHRAETTLDVVRGLHSQQGLWDAPAKNVDWVIVGGESGPQARAMHPQWARDIRDQCVAGGVPFLFKQWGEWGPADWKIERLADETDSDYKARAMAIGATHVHTNNAYRDENGDWIWHLYQPDYKPWSVERAALGADGTHAPIRRWGKKTAGRDLDGRTWDEFPQATS